MKDLGLPVPQTVFDDFNAAAADVGLRACFGDSRNVR